ncbi:MAG: alpha/beta hydrolase [Planctomycetota bacterium]
MPSIDVGGVRMAYSDRGAGPVLLLVHGFPLDHTMWDGVARRLEDRCRVISPDLRGYGASSLGDVDADGGVPMHRYADDLAGLLDALRIDGPVVYAGFSMGGYIGWQFFRRRRDRVRALAAIDTRAAADDEQTRNMRLHVARHVMEWGAERVAEAMLPKLFSADALRDRADLVERTVAVISGADPRAIAAAQIGMAARPDMRGLLPTIDVPAAVIVGEDDAISTPAEMRAMADAMPNARYTEVAGAGHMAPVEEPAAVAEALAALVL